MSHKRKYPPDFSRCDGGGCKVKEKCARHEAREEALELNLSYGHYLGAKECVANDCSEFVAIEIEPST